MNSDSNDKNSEFMVDRMFKLISILFIDSQHDTICYIFLNSETIKIDVQVNRRSKITQSVKLTQFIN